MTLRQVRIGAVEDGIQLDDADYDSAIETDMPIECADPVLGFPQMVVTTGSLAALIASSSSAATYTNGDTTPSVQNASYMVITNTVATTITNFDDGVVGQVIRLIFTNSNTTIDRTNAYLSGGINFVSTQYDTLTLIKYGTKWYELSRGINS